MIEVSLLDVPYAPQLGIGADKHKSDCGAASVSMIIGAYLKKDIDVDSLYDLANNSGDGYLSVTQLQNVLNYYDISSEWRSDITKLDLANILINSKPCIVLFNYKAFREKIGKTHDTHFTGAHFAVMIGMDTKYFYLNDPLWLNNDGYALKISHDDWMYCWNSALNDGNPACAAIIPVKAMDGSNTIEPATGALYAFKIIEKQGVTIRTTHAKTKSNATGQYLAYDGNVNYCYEEFNDGTILWGAINDIKTLWVALRYGKTDYIQKV